MKCLSCNSKNLEIYSKKSELGLEVYFCKKCMFYVCGNSFSEINEKISKLYLKNYWDEHKSLTGTTSTMQKYGRTAASSIKSGYSDGESLGRKRSWVSQLKYCEPHIRNKNKILEIGSGAGHASFWFEQKGFVVTGIEPDERNVKLINEKLKQGKIFQGFGEKFGSEKKFEIIWMSHVLEHMVDLEGFINKIKSNLDENGIFFIEVPNAEHKPTLITSINDPHVYHFSKKALSNFMKNMGFKIISCDCFRPATKVEGMENKIFGKKFPYYPRILTDEKSGTDLRIILK